MIAIIAVALLTAHPERSAEGAESKGAAQSPEAPAPTQTPEGPPPSSAEVKVDAPEEPPPTACARWKAPGLIEGPISVGYGPADMTLGRRACPRSEVGLGVGFGAIIDTPNFYGNVALTVHLHGAWAINPKTEIFAQFNAIDSEYTVNAVINPPFFNPSVGDFTLGVARQVYETDSLAGAVSARLLLPTASNIPGTRNAGAELGHSVSMRAAAFLEVHGYAGVGFTFGIGPVALPALTLVGMLGAALSPTSWFSLVVDLSGGIVGRSFFAVTGGVRLRIFKLGIELGVSRPLAGTDRHDVIVGARFDLRL